MASFFRRSSVSSSTSESSVSSKKSSKLSVRPEQLSFSSTASPNSRLLSLSLDDSAAPISRAGSGRTRSVSNGQPKLATPIVQERTQSPEPVSDECDHSASEDSESAESESDDEQPIKPVINHKNDDAPHGKHSNGGFHRPTSKATAKQHEQNHASKKLHVRLAEEGRAAVPTHRVKLNKPLDKLTFDDVALTEQELRDDIAQTRNALHLFLDSSMFAAEEICLSGADSRLYYSLGFALIQVIKSLATFEPEDLAMAIQCCKNTATITSLLRKKDHGALENVGRLVKGSTSVNSIRGMTLVQRHAELIFAEATLLKAVIGIIYSGDFIAFLKEALNMRNAYSIYRTLARYVETADADNGGVPDPTIDEDFRSGVFLGNGLISMILSLLPSTVLKIMEVFGFTGDREYALKTLMKGGKWVAGQKEPGMSPEKEGIRRQICDMVLLAYHLVIASYLPVGGVDVPTADAILHYNLERYPKGVFFLYFSGRLYSTQGLLETAYKQFHLAINAQKEYIQLQHICHWDLGLVSLAMGDWSNGYECFNILNKDSNWSKAIYAYAKATSLYEQKKEIKRADEIMRDVPDLMQRIAGKSIPLEKFVARRAKKYVHQGNRLVLPGIELGYVLNCLGMAPRFALFETHLHQISVVLAELHACKDPATWGKNGDEYWDDYCLAHLLRGIVLRFIAHPEAHTVARPVKSQIPTKEADEQALISYNNVISNGTKIQHDQFLVWFAHYELGRLYDSMGQYARAAQEYELVLSGKNLETANKKDKGKVSLQNMCVLRSNSALVTLRMDKKI